MCNRLSKKLKLIREELKLSEEYVANVIGINVSTIIDVENGNKELRSSELGKLCELYGIKKDDLRFNEEIDSKIFARTSSKLCEHDEMEIINIIALKNKIKKYEV